MSWAGLAGLVLRAPGRVLAVSLVILGVPSLGLIGFDTSYDQVSQLPEESDSVQGFRALSGSFGPGQVQPIVVVARAREGTIWTDEAFATIDQLTLNLRKVPGVAQVRSITRPTTGGVSQEQLDALGLGDVEQLTQRLPRAIEGLTRGIDGLGRLRDGLERIRASIPQQRAGIDRGLEGLAQLREGVGRIVAGLGRLANGLTEARDGLLRLADEVAEPAVRSLEAAWQDLREMGPLARLDPQFAEMARHVGEALGALTGTCPDATGIGPQPEECPAGQRIDPRYAGLAPTLRDISEGLDRAVRGVGRGQDALEVIDGGLARFEESVRAQPEQLDRLDAGVSEMIGGLGRLIPGLVRLREGLTTGFSLLDRTGLIPEPTGDVPITATLATAFPKLREQLGFFTGDEDRATRVYVILDRQPYDPRALEASDRIRDIAELSLRRSPLRADRVAMTGASPFFADIQDVNRRDSRVIVLAVVAGVFLVLVLLLRSLVAPVYLVATVLLSYAATLGLTSFVFQGLLGETGLVWWLPSFLFVVLVALGADYNIFLVGRIREEAGRMDTRRAVAAGLAATGHVITSAGLILAGTFAALLAAPLDGMVQLGFSATLGILVDTFVVRSLLVPSIAVLAGSGSWWPSRRALQP